MADEGNLGEYARAAIRSKKLPSRAPQHVWGGQGLGEACAVCEQPVTPEQMGFELEFGIEGAPPAQLHVRCFAAWERICGRAEAEAGDAMPSIAGEPL